MQGGGTPPTTRDDGVIVSGLWVFAVFKPETRPRTHVAAAIHTRVHVYIYIYERYKRYYFARAHRRWFTRRVPGQRERFNLFGGLPHENRVCSETLIFRGPAHELFVAPLCPPPPPPPFELLNVLSLRAHISPPFLPVRPLRIRGVRTCQKRSVPPTHARRRDDETRFSHLKIDTSEFTNRSRHENIFGKIFDFFIIYVCHFGASTVTTGSIS